jgi:hypothetical protein
MMTDHRILKRLVLALAMLLPLSCSQAPKQISFFVEDPAQFGEVLWPDLPEVPRYRYAGQLLGEDNFVAPEGDKPGTLSKVWKWVAGIGGEVEGPERSLVRPQSGMVAGSRIYVTDVGRGAVFVFDKAKGELQIWDQVGDGGSFVSPIGITSGKEGSVLVADSELGRVVRLSADGKTLGTLGEGILARCATRSASSPMSSTRVNTTSSCSTITAAWWKSLASAANSRANSMPPRISRCPATGCT